MTRRAAGRLQQAGRLRCGDLPGHAAGDQLAQHRVQHFLAQPHAAAPTKWAAAAHEYVPSPVSFVSDDKEPGYSRDHGPGDTTARREDSG